jgi:hypothetical protein
MDTGQIGRSIGVSGRDEFVIKIREVKVEIV